MSAQQNRPPLPLDGRASRGFQAITMSLLEKDPARRHGPAAAVAGTLERLFVSLVSASPQAPRNKTRGERR
jgi:hypothetical protein